MKPTAQAVGLSADVMLPQRGERPVVAHSSYGVNLNIVPQPEKPQLRSPPWLVVP